MILNYINWNINPEIVSLFGIKLRYYGILFVGGLVLCVYILNWIFKRENISQSNLEKLTIYGFIGIFVGARLGHCLFYQPTYYFNNPLEIILPIQRSLGGGYEFVGYQGLASHGGTLGLIIALILYSSKTKESIIKTIDLIAIVAPLGACFIRLANLMNSEIIGIPQMFLGPSFSKEKTSYLDIQLNCMRQLHIYSFLILHFTCIRKSVKNWEMDSFLV